MTTDQFLQTFAAALAERLGKARFDRYFTTNCKLQWVNGELVVGVPNLFFKDWLASRFQPDLEAVVEEVHGKAAPIRFEIDPALFQAVREDLPEVDPPVELPPSPEAKPQISTDPRRWKSLEEFAVGASNRLAYTAGRNLIDRVGESPTMLTIYGEPGVGKTHLLEGLYLEVRRSVGDAAVLCISAEEFTNRFYAALAAKATAPFRRQFRELQGLFVDSIDFLAGKPVMQEEFLHTLEALHRLGRLVIVTTQVHPRELKDFAPQLIDRLISGGVYELERPDLRLRQELLRVKAKKVKLTLTREGEMTLAEMLRGNVREIEGVLHTLATMQQVLEKPLTLAQLKETAQKLVRTPVRIVTLTDIEKVLCKQLGIDSKTLRTATRARSVSHARMLAMYLARQLTKASANEIARHFGYKSHSMVIAAEKKVREWIEKDAPLFQALERSPVREFLENVERELNRG